MLDNAADESQVLPLLPGCSGSLTLVTSRLALVNLAVDVTRIHLDVFAQPEALALIRAAAGDERFDADPDAAVRIAKVHGFHPHSLGLTAGRIRTFPDWTLTDHLGRLTERIEPARLDGAVAVDDILDDRVRRAHQLRFENDVRDNISLSYDGLGPGARLILRRLVLHPGDDMDIYAAAALTDDDLEATQTYIDELLGANLLHQRTPGRYGQHDLVHRYAYQHTYDEDRDCDRRDALRRLFDHYLHSAYAAEQILSPHRSSIDLAPPMTRLPPRQFADADEAMDWFNDERTVLLAAIDRANDLRLDSHVWQLAWTLETFLDLRGYWADWAATQQAALHAAKRLADTYEEARADRSLGLAFTRLRRYSDAHSHLQHALDLYARVSDDNGRAHTHLNLAQLLARQDRFAEALDHTQTALGLYQTTGHRVGNARAINAIAWYHTKLGNFEQVLAACQTALRLFQELEDHTGEAATWDTCGYAHHQRGNYHQAIDCYQRALRLWNTPQGGDRYGTAETLTHLGDSYSRLGDHESARGVWQSAYEVLCELGHPDADELRAKLDRGQADGG